MIEILIFWNLFALACGIMDAGIFAHGVAHDMLLKQDYNIHTFLNIPRGIVWAFCVFAIIDLHPGEVFLGSIGLLMQFPAMHDGAYYQSRHFIDRVPGYHFLTSKNQTTARISIGAAGRVIAWVLGVGVCFVPYFISQ